MVEVVTSQREVVRSVTRYSNCNPLQARCDFSNASIDPGLFAHRVVDKLATSDRVTIVV